MATKKKIYTDAMDDRMDKKAGIKESSPKDIALDKVRGVPEDDSPTTSNGKTPFHSRRQP